jgi:hypothetical protein
MADARQTLGARMIVGPQGNPGMVAADYILKDVRSTSPGAKAGELAKVAA